MKKKRSKGVTIFAILIILGSGFQMLGLRIEYLKIFMHPLPEIVILARYFIVAFLLILGIVSGIGILCLKNIFRKIAVIISSMVILDYLVSVPFFILKNVPNFIENHNQVVAMIAENPTISQSALSSIMWILIILTWVVDFSFCGGVIYFFTRPKVKQQFEEAIPMKNGDGALPA